VNEALEAARLLAAAALLLRIGAALGVDFFGSFFFSAVSRLVKGAIICF